MNLGQILDEAVKLVPERTALVVGTDRMTYAALDEEAQRCARAFARRGVAPGDRIAVVDQGSPLAVAAIVGIARIGAVSAQMNPDLSVEELSALCELVGATAGVADDAHGPKLRSVLDGPVLTGDDVAAGAGRDGASVPPRPAIDDGATATVIFSSGTTGMPKPVFISHGTIADRLRYYGAPVDPDRDPAVDMMCVPMFHIGGALGLFITLSSGKTMVIVPRFDAGEWLRIVEEHRVGQTFVVPTMLRRILDHPTFSSRDLGCLRSLSYGAASAQPELIRRAVAALPSTDLVNVFGQTETLGAYAALSSEDHRAGRKLDSVGKPFPGVEVRVVDLETREDVGTGCVGEALVRAAQNVTSDWLETGDLVLVDEDGYLFVKGRVKDTINRGGEKFGPTEVEAVIRTLPGVDEVAVAGVPDEEMGERVGALVVGSAGLRPEDVQEHCRSHLARFKVPELVEFVEELPYNRYGKVPRSAVVDAIVAKGRR